jgi:hypothetical protein
VKFRKETEKKISTEMQKHQRSSQRAGIEGRSETKMSRF